MTSGRIKGYLKATVPGLRPAVRAVKSLFWRVVPARYRFIWIYRSQTWGSPEESLSGSGSSLEQTTTIRARLPRLFEELKVRSLLDIPCGDFHWMKEVDLNAIEYVGADIVPHIIKLDRARYGNAGHRRFVTLDITRDRLPRVDVILCRDCLTHLPNQGVADALANIKRSGSTYLLTTTFPGRGQNADIVAGDWRPLDLGGPPFRLPEPDLTINESEGKTLSLWKVVDLP